MSVEPYQPFPVFAQFAPEIDITWALFDTTVRRLENRKAEVGDTELERAVEMATRWAAIDTNAIEGIFDISDRGFTISVAKTVQALDTLRIELGEDAHAHVRDALAGYDYILDVVTRKRPANENWIKELHAKICDSQETYTVVVAENMATEQRPHQQGQYKDEPNNPTTSGDGEIIHSYAPPESVGAEMHRFVDELNSDDFLRAHPIVQAAYAHYAFVCIHPFADGNGRVARALASTYVQRAYGVPLVIFRDQRDGYFSALEAADRGSYSPFVIFIRECQIDIMAMLEVSLREPDIPRAAQTLLDFGPLLWGRGGLEHDEVDKLARRVRDAWLEALATSIDQLQLPGNITLSAGNGSTAPQAPEGYRVPPTAREALQLSGEATGAAKVGVNFLYPIRVPLASNATPEDFVVFRGGGDTSVIEIYQRDVYPRVSQALKYRLQAAAEIEVDRMVKAVAEKAEARLRESGYIG